MNFFLPDADATQTAGLQLSPCCLEPTRIFMYGDLGAGKTTWVRGFLRGLGYTELVKSPTYTLVETYSLSPYPIHHFDWYRIDSVYELESIGIWDYVNSAAHCLIEWPDKGEALGIQPDLRVYFKHTASGRDCSYTAETIVGKRILDRLL